MRPFLQLELMLVAVWLLVSIGIGMVAARLALASKGPYVCVERSLLLVATGACMGLLAAQFLWLDSIVAGRPVADVAFRAHILHGVAAVLGGGAAGMLLDLALSDLER